MNDKDKEAFEKYLVENNVNQRQIWNELLLDEVWHAACEYKQKEIDELKSFWKPIIEKFETKFPNVGNANTLALTSLTQAFDIHCKNEKLQTENDELKDRLKHEVDAYKEAARTEAEFVNELQAENAKLNSKLALSKKIIDELVKVAEVHLDDTFEKIKELDDE